jgi:hypothetical protein
MSTTVLDRLRQVNTERRAGSKPETQRARVWVTPEGRVVIGDEVEKGDDRMLSEVHPAVFA